MLPHERSLVKKLESKPFALVAVDSDPDKAKFKERAAKEEVTWPTFWDQSTGGPIATAWNVRSWPTIYVIDAKGVIRHRDLRGDALEKAVDELVAEAEAAATPSK
jgi:hypothetical protein